VTEAVRAREVTAEHAAEEQAAAEDQAAYMVFQIGKKKLN